MAMKMETKVLSPVEKSNVNPNLISSEGQFVVLKTEKVLKVMKADKGKVLDAGNLKFKIDNAVGCPYGSKFLVEKQKLVRQYFHKTETAAAFVSKASTDESVQDNRLLTSKDGASQNLSSTDIEVMKAEGKIGTAIIGEVIKNSATFKQKTVFSQEKYVKAKSKKYSVSVIIYKPTTRLLAELYYTRGADKVCNLRPDSLATMLVKSNVRSGSNVMVVDACKGLITGAVLERVGDVGTVVQLHAGDTVLRSVVDNYNFSTTTLNNLVGYPLYGMDHVNHPKQMTDAEIEAIAEEDATKEKASTRTDKEWTPAKKEEFDKNQAARKLRKDNRRGGLLKSYGLLSSKNMDSLLVVCKFNPLQILKSTLSLLAPSRPFVIFSQYKEPLLECYTWAKSQGVINLDLMERWTQEYQVLPNRTHPHMMMDACSGFILSGTTTARLAPTNRITTTVASSKRKQPSQISDDTEQQQIKTDDESEAKKSRTSSN